MIGSLVSAGMDERWREICSVCDKRFSLSWGVSGKATCMFVGQMYTQSDKQRMFVSGDFDLSTWLWFQR